MTCHLALLLVSGNQQRRREAVLRPWSCHAGHESSNLAPSTGESIANRLSKLIGAQLRVLPA